MDMSTKFPLSAPALPSLSSRGAAGQCLAPIHFSAEELEELSRILYEAGLYAIACEDEHAASTLRKLSDRVETHLHADLIARRDWMQPRLPLEPAGRLS